MTKSWLKQAFAVDAPGPAEPTPGQAEVVDRVVRQIVKRHLTTPALLFLEMSRPLNFIGSQTMHFFHPFVAAITDARGYGEFAAFLEHRGSIDFICRRLEDTEAECGRKDAEPPKTVRSDP